jgi:hypothetical protein
MGINKLLHVTTLLTRPTHTVRIHVHLSYIFRYIDGHTSIRHPFLYSRLLQTVTLFVCVGLNVVCKCQIESRWCISRSSRTRSNWELVHCSCFGPLWTLGNLGNLLEFVVIELAIFTLIISMLLLKIIVPYSLDALDHVRSDLLLYVTKTLVGYM